MKTPQLIAFGCLAMVATLQSCSKSGDEAGGDAGGNADVRFAKTAFFSMVNGSSEVETMIDWEAFQAMGDDLGKDYRALATDAEKIAARKSFLAGFSASVPNIKANPGAITNWRVQSETPSETIVAANMQLGPVLLLTVSKRDGKQKISAMQIKQ